MIRTQHMIDHWRAWRVEVPGVYRTGATEDAAVAALLAFLKEAEDDSVS